MFLLFLVSPTVLDTESSSLKVTLGEDSRCSKQELNILIQNYIFFRLHRGSLKKLTAFLPLCFCFLFLIDDVLALAYVNCLVFIVC